MKASIYIAAPYARARLVASIAALLSDYGINVVGTWWREAIASDRSPRGYPPDPDPVPEMTQHARAVAFEHNVMDMEASGFFIALVFADEGKEMFCELARANRPVLTLAFDGAAIPLTSYFYECGAALTNDLADVAHQIGCFVAKHLAQARGAVEAR